MMITVPNPYFPGTTTIERVLNFDGEHVWIFSDTGMERWHLSQVAAV